MNTQAFGKTMTPMIECLRRAARSVLPFPVFRYCSEICNMLAGSHRMGLVQYRTLRALGHDVSQRATSGVVVFRISTLLHPIAVRPGTTDSVELIHSALRQAYNKYLPDGQVRLIIDAGANIGDTTSWYLSRFPDARVFAVEPEGENYQLLSQNCEPYGTRAVLIQRGLWSRTSRLKVVGAGGPMASGISVVESLAGEAYDCIGISPLDILKQSGESQIDIFKCDIEGAECEVFRDGCDEWLSRTRSIFIEIHNNEAHRIVMNATRRHAFSCHIYRELHIFRKF